MWNSQPTNKEAIFANFSNILKNSNKHFEFYSKHLFQQIGLLSHWEEAFC